MADRPEGTPVDQVRKMRSQGVSDDKIVEALQRDGYLSSQIFDAMTQADLRIADEASEVTQDFPTTVHAEAPVSLPETRPDGTIFSPSVKPPEGISNVAMETEIPYAMPRSMPTMSRSASSSYAGSGTEEIIESIIDEKWEEVVANISKVVEWKNDTEKKISHMEKDLEDLRLQFDKLHSAVIGKVGEYDKNILNVGAEIKAMEKAFSKILPDFADSVTELTSLVDDLKHEKKVSKKKTK